MVGTSLVETKYTDLDFADDVVLFSELWGVLESALLIFPEEAAELGLQINWNKNKASRPFHQRYKGKKR